MILKLYISATRAKARKVQLQAVYDGCVELVKNLLSLNDFLEHDEYVDVLGGMIMDAYRGDKERVTWAVSVDGVQVLTHINMSTHSKVFQFSAEGAEHAIRYLESLLGQS